MFAGFSGHGNSIHNIIPLLKKKNVDLSLDLFLNAFSDRLHDEKLSYETCCEFVMQGYTIYSQLSLLLTSIQ